MSIQSKKEECALSVKAPEPGENDFTETACGLARALGKVSLTPVIGAGLLGTAAHDALGTGAVGTMVKAKELIYKVQEGDAEDVGGEDEVEVGSISETVNKSAERAAATPIEIFDPDTKCQGPNIYAKTTSRRAFHSSYASQMAKQSRMHLRRS